MRKRRAEKRRVFPDPKYGDVIVSKFINYIMIQGKKNTARRCVYDAFEIIADKTKKKPPEVFKPALGNVAPLYRSPLA